MIKKVLFGKANNAYIQLFRYLFAGGTAFLADVSILYLLTEYAHIHYLLSSLAGFSAGLTITYLMSIFWIFDEKSKNNKAVELTIFIIIGTIGLGLTSLFMWLFTSLLLLHYLFSKILTTAIVFVWNFVAKKQILFTKKD
ncbi:MAG: GtrA family protein [Paludibacter sp.]